MNQQTTGQEEQTIKYWDWSATAYRFFAYAANGATVSEVASSENVTFSFDANASITTAISAFLLTRSSDLDLTTWNTTTGILPDYSSRQFGQPVQLEFLKPFAKVRFMFIFGQESTGVLLGDKEFRPTDNTKIIRKGTVTITYPLTGTETSESFTMTPATPEEQNQLLAFTEDYDPEDDTKEYTETDNGWYTVLPNDHQGTYTLSVVVNGDTKPKSCVVPAAFMQWLPGYSYTYVFKINEEGGVEIEMVQSAVTPWLEDIPGSKTVYNW